ncbi:hypothetical protein JXA48_04990 [Candidatus Woesearchaeota archaeon]|nr:hypothetical protein [Candidatus Woesearchaeota archaeon]
MKKSNKFRNAVLGTAAGLGMLLATSCSTQKMTSTYGLPTTPIVDNVQTEQVSQLDTLPVSNGVNYFTDAVVEEENNNAETSEFGTRLNARKVMNEQELRDLRKTLYPVNTNLNLGAQNLYLKPVLAANGDTLNFVLGAVSPDYKCTQISKEEGVDLLNRNKKTPSKKVVTSNTFTGEPVKVNYDNNKFGVGINPKFAFGNGFGLAADANIFNFLVSVESPLYSTDFSSKINSLDSYENQTERRQNGDMNLTYVITTTDHKGLATQDFGWGFGAGYQLPIGNWRLGLTANGKKSTVNISESSEELSKEVFSTIGDVPQGPEDATLWSESNSTSHSGWYLGGTARVSYVLKNGLEFGVNGSLLAPLKGVKEFDFNSAKIQTDNLTNLGFMVRYNF